jgi:hypothetical protein
MKEAFMSRCSHVATFAALSIVWCGLSASAETLRCQSVNGNLNCAGSGGVSCQTIDGKKTCVSGHGDVVQSFGNGPSSNSSDDADDEGLDNAPSPPATKQRLERHGPSGQKLLLEQDGTKLHLRTNWLSIDRD